MMCNRCAQNINPIVKQFKKRTRTYRVRQVGRLYAAQLYERVTLFLKLFRYSIKKITSKCNGSVGKTLTVASNSRTGFHTGKSIKTHSLYFPRHPIFNSRQKFAKIVVGRQIGIVFSAHARAIFQPHLFCHFFCPPNMKS